MGQTLRFPNSRIHRALLSLALSVLLVGSGLFIVNQTTRLGLSGGDTAPDVNLPDLAIYDDGITFSNDKPHDGDVIEICGNIHNIGNATALEVRTDFHDHFNGSSVKIGTTWIQEIPPSENRITCTSWTAHPAGIHGILVKVDPENRIEEFREDNNAADRAIEVLPKDTVLPDLTIDGPIHFSKDHPKEGEVIKICVTVVNIGAGAADEIPVKFTDVFHGVSTKIGVTYIGHLDPGAWAETCVEWTAKPAGEHKIVVYVDPENKIPESNEDNNVEDAMIVVDPPPPQVINVFLTRFDNDGDKKLDDLVIVVYGSERNAIAGAEVYIDGKFFGRTPDSGTLMAYNFSQGWHAISVRFNGNEANAEFYSQG